MVVEGPISQNHVVESASSARHHWSFWKKFDPPYLHHQEGRFGGPFRFTSFSVRRPVPNEFKTRSRFRARRPLVGRVLPITGPV